MKTNNKNILNYINNIYDNLVDLKNIVMDEYTNPFSVDIFEPIFTEIYDIIRNIYLEQFYILNFSQLEDNLHLIRTDINKINFVIRYILIVQYLRNNINPDNINYDIFDNQFLLLKQYFTYISNDNEEIDDIVKKIINYNVLDDKFTLSISILNIDELENNIDVSCSLKYIFQIFLNTESAILKFISKIKLTDKVSNPNLKDYLLRKEKITWNNKKCSKSNNSSSSKTSSKSSTSSSKSKKKIKKSNCHKDNKDKPENILTNKSNICDYKKDNICIYEKKSNKLKKFKKKFIKLFLHLFYLFVIYTIFYT